MEVEPIAGIVFGLEHLTNPMAADPEAEWDWAYILSLGIVRFSFVKFR